MTTLSSLSAAAAARYEAVRLQGRTPACLAAEKSLRHLLPPGDRVVVEGAHGKVRYTRCRVTRELERVELRPAKKLPPRGYEPARVYHVAPWKEDAR